MAAQSDQRSASQDVSSPSHRADVCEGISDELNALHVLSDSAKPRQALMSGGNHPVLQPQAEPIHVDQCAVPTDRADQDALPGHARLAQCASPAREFSRGRLAHDGELLAKQHEREQTQKQLNPLLQGHKVRIWMARACGLALHSWHGCWVTRKSLGRNSSCR